MRHALIRVEGVSKQYRIGEKQRYPTLRDALSQVLKNPTGRLFGNGRRSREGNIIWALRDVSFELERGDVLGLIGQNGSGKSTLLKILSRITPPTEGCVKIRGRVGTLLEVGTGFHPELTGRENIYLNGSILGMQRQEINRKFDEIVAFAEIEQFLDTPVKHYSSGMYVRLAFSVAAHLEPDILIVDEVLAVGDLSFQKKSQSKMGDLANDGRTVIFVSHNMNAIQQLCPQSMLLEKGKMVAFGGTRQVINRYLKTDNSRQLPEKWISTKELSHRGTKQAYLSAIRYTSGNEEAGFYPYPNGPLELTLCIQSDQDRTIDSLAVMFCDRNGIKLVNADTFTTGQRLALRKGENLVQLRIEALYLNPGDYHLGWWLNDGSLNGILDFAESAIDVKVVEVDQNRLALRPKSDGLVACQVSVLNMD